MLLPGLLAEDLPCACVEIPQEDNKGTMQISVGSEKFKSCGVYIAFNFISPYYGSWYVSRL